MDLVPSIRDKPPLLLETLMGEVIYQLLEHNGSNPIIYKCLNRVQRTAKGDKKALLSEQCKEIEENNRMGKTRHLFKKIRDTKGTFHAMMDTIKDRNGMDLTKA